MPCVNGSPFEMVCIQPGSSSIGTFAPQKISSTPKMMFESTAVSRTIRPSPR